METEKVCVVARQDVVTAEVMGNGDLWLSSEDVYGDVNDILIAKINVKPFLHRLRAIVKTHEDAQ